MKKLRVFLSISALSLAVAACSDSGTEIVERVPADDELQSPAQAGNGQSDPGLENIVGTALEAGTFNTLAAALEATDLISVLSDEARKFTVFAPTDDAFAKLGNDTINALLADPDTLRDILLYHVLPDSVVNADTAISLAGSTVTTANENNIALSLNDGELFVNMSRVIAADVSASNGIIHVIDTVLLPPADMQEPAQLSIVETAVATGSFNILVAALQATGLDAALANTDDSFTVFAPTDEAFAKLGNETINALLGDPETLSNILLYHVIGGRAVDSTTAISLAGTSVTMANSDTLDISVQNNQLLVNDSIVIQADVQTSNGVIHVIDSVLLPTAEQITSAPADPDAPTPAGTGTLLDVAKTAGNFTTLVAALEATGLAGAIGHSGDLYTVFAPTDAAFAALGQAAISALLADPETLRDILLYHVIPGAVVDAESAVGLVGTSIQAGNGDRFMLDLRGENLFINDSKIIATDIRGVNGIIHVIDAVLIATVP